MQIIPLLLTRPEGANAAFADRLPEQVRAGVRLVESPLMRIEATGADATLGAQEAAVFSSVNGVRFAPEGAGRRAWCVGEATARAARAAGWRADCAGRTAEELIRTLAETRPAAPLCHFCGVHVRGDVAGALRDAGLIARSAVVYDQVLLPLTEEARAALEGPAPVIVPLFSPRAAAHFAGQVTPGPQLRIVALSAAVADALWTEGREGVLVAEDPTREAMLRAIEKVHRLCRLG